MPGILLGISRGGIVFKYDSKKARVGDTLAF